MQEFREIKQFTKNTFSYALRIKQFNLHLHLRNPKTVSLASPFGRTDSNPVPDGSHTRQKPKFKSAEPIRVLSSRCRGRGA